MCSTLSLHLWSLCLHKVGMMDMHWISIKYMIWFISLPSYQRIYMVIFLVLFWHIYSLLRFQTFFLTKYSNVNFINATGHDDLRPNRTKLGVCFKYTLPRSKNWKKKMSTLTILVYMYSGTATNRTNFKTFVKFKKVSDLPNDRN